jgi:hypothetical protein
MPQPLITSRIVPQTLRYLHTHGVSTVRLRRRFGLDEADLQSSTVRLPPKSIVAFFQEAATEAKDENLGLQVALNMSRGEYGLIEFAARSATTLADALKIFVETLGLPGEPVRLELRPSPNGVEFHHWVKSTS